MFHEIFHGASRPFSGFEFLIRYLVDSACFAALSTSLPDCTLNEWPIPIVGSLLKSFSCIYANIVPSVEAICEYELEMFATCLDGIDRATQADCTTYIQTCAGGGDEEIISWHMMLPPPFLGMPLSDTCTRVATESAGRNENNGEMYARGVANYNKFIELCTSPDDAELWAVTPSKWDIPIKPLYEKPVTTKTSPSSTTAAAPPPVPAPAPPVLASSAAAGTADNGGSTAFGSFVTGMMTGAIALFVGLFIYGKTRSAPTQRFDSIGGGGATLYNDLELTDSTPTIT